MTVTVQSELPPTAGHEWKKDLAAQKRAIRKVTKAQIGLGIGSATYFVPVYKVDALTIVEKAAKDILHTGGITVVVAPLSKHGATQAQFHPRHTNGGFLPAVVDVTENPARWPDMFRGCDNPSQCDYGTSFHE